MMRQHALQLQEQVQCRQQSELHASIIVDGCQHQVVPATVRTDNRSFQSIVVQPLPPSLASLPNRQGGEFLDMSA